MFKKISFFSIALLGLVACNKDSENPNESELITTAIYTLTPASGTPIELTFKDTDGDGGNAPVITTSGLRANTTYNATLTLKNESTNPSQDLSTQVQSEGKDHQVFFQSSGITANITYVDRDANGKPIGLASTFVTGAASTGSLKITLRHKPTKTATGVSDGNIANAGGETDLEVTFPIVIQ